MTTAAMASSSYRVPWVELPVVVRAISMTAAIPDDMKAKFARRRVPLLATYFLERFSATRGRQVRLTPETLELPASAVEAVLSERTRWIAVTAASVEFGCFLIKKSVARSDCLARMPKKPSTWLSQNGCDWQRWCSPPRCERFRDLRAQ